MIERYTRAGMGQIWSIDNRFQKMLETEIAVAEVQASMKIIPRAAAQAIKSRSQYNIQRILEIEQVTKHDVIAFVSNVAESVGEMGKYVHFGMTSSDILDTALSLQVADAGLSLHQTIDLLLKEMKKIIIKHQNTLCAGRTHGMFAEPTTFGYKMAGFFFETKRNQERVQKAIEQMQICKLSGAVGTYSSQPFEVEEKVAKKLNLKPESAATQVIPRDRHAELITALALLGSGLERLAVELRHLQRSEVGEVSEGFNKGQKGSSAMPHKKNPISSENISGLSRLLRSYTVVSMENICLWHERDISHSSAERVIFPDAFILADYMVDRMTQVLKSIEIHKDRMIENMERSQGQLMSSHLLLALVEKGLSREEAYAHVQRVSLSLKKNEHLRDQLKKDLEISAYLSAKEINKILSGDRHKKSFKNNFKRIMKNIS